MNNTSILNGDSKTINISNVRTELNNIIKIREAEKKAFSDLLDEYLKIQVKHGHNLENILLDLYEKRIISSGMIKIKGNIDEYQLNALLADRNISLVSPVGLEEEDTIKEIKDYL